jgi:hypothetical protein
MTHRPNGGGVLGNRKTVDVTLSVSPNRDYDDPFQIRLEVGESNSAVDMTLFDDVTLCKATNRCEAMAPQKADINIVLLIDVSGSIGSVQGSLFKATEFVSSLYRRLHSTPQLPGIDQEQISQLRVSAFTFHSGGASCR